MKMTKKEMFATAINAINGEVLEAEVLDTVVAGLKHEIDMLNKRSSKERKPTKTQVENEGFKADIIAFLAEQDTAFTISELQENIPSIAELKNQRVTHLLTALIEDGRVKREVIKRKAFFSIA